MFGIVNRQLSLSHIQPGTLSGQPCATGSSPGIRMDVQLYYIRYGQCLNVRKRSIYVVLCFVLVIIERLSFVSQNNGTFIKQTTEGQTVRQWN